MKLRTHKGKFVTMFFVWVYAMVMVLLAPNGYYAMRKIIHNDGWVLIGVIISAIHIVTFGVLIVFLIICVVKWYTKL